MRSRTICNRSLPAQGFDRLGGDHRAPAAPRLDHAALLQFHERPGHGVRVDDQLVGQVADAGDEVAGRSEPAATANVTWATICS